MQVLHIKLRHILFSQLLIRENRYVLFLTENYAALNILKDPRNYLSNRIKIAQGAGVPFNKESMKNIQPFILFGSSFPGDKDYTKVSHLLNTTATLITGL